MSPPKKSSSFLPTHGTLPEPRRSVTRFAGAIGLRHPWISGVLRPTSWCQGLTRFRKPAKFDAEIPDLVLPEVAVQPPFHIGREFAQNIDARVDQNRVRSGNENRPSGMKTLWPPH